MERFVNSAKKKIAALVSIGALLLLAGCASTTAAFTVGKNSVSVTDIQTSVDNIVAARKGVDTTGMTLQTGNALIESQVQFFLFAELLSRLAQEHGLSVTPAELAQEKAGVIQQVGGAAIFPKALINAGIDPKSVDLYFTSVLYSQKLSDMIKKSGTAAADVSAALTSLVSQEAIKLGVTVNPRYGKWDAKNGVLIPADAASGAVTTKK